MALILIILAGSCVSQIQSSRLQGWRLTLYSFLNLIYDCTIHVLAGEYSCT